MAANNSLRLMKGAVLSKGGWTCNSDGAGIWTIARPASISSSCKIDPAVISGVEEGQVVAVDQLALNKRPLRGAADVPAGHGGVSLQPESRQEGEENDLSQYGFP
jgi:hypothetical protein